MSNTVTDASPPSRANTRELRLLVQTSFSAGEIRRLLEAWGAGPEELEGDAATLAHHLVRIGDKRFGIPEMARRFRAEKPLLEWPEDDWGSDKWAGKGPGIDVEATVVDAPIPPEQTVTEEAAAPSTQLPDGTKAAPPAEENPAPPSSVDAPASRPANPMIFLEPEAMRAKPERRGIDPKWLAIGGGAIVVVVGLAFVAGLAWRPGEAAAPPQGKPEDAPTLMGARAAGFLDRSLMSVADLCELDVDGAPTRDVLIVAQESCGPQKPGPSKRRPELGDEPTPPRPDEPARVRPRAAPEPEPKRNDDPAPAPAAGGGKGSCTKSCMRVQDECLGACGDEPKDAKLYDAFQKCTSKCYTGSARCRTSCP